MAARRRRGSIHVVNQISPRTSQLPPSEPEKPTVMGPVLVVLRDTRPASADALVLGRRLAELGHTSVLAMRATSARTARAERLELARTRAWARAWLDDEPELLPVAGPSPQGAIHEVARERHAQFIVAPSELDAPRGQVRLGRWEASAVVHEAPCAVAVAPGGYRNAPRSGPLAVGVAFDGLPESLAALRSAHALAHAAGGTLRVIAVASVPDATRELDEAVAGLGREIDVALETVSGDPIAQLTRSSRTLDLLVCGSRDRRPLLRVALGRTSLALMRSAACPLLVVAPGAPIPSTARVGA